MNIIFDLDGTLIDPRDGIIGSLKYMLHALELPLAANSDLERFIGPPLQENVVSLVGQDDPAKVGRGIDLYREHFASRGIYQANVYSGIDKTLERLQYDAATLFVATSKPLSYTNRIIDHFDLRRFFTDVYGAELDGTRAKKVDLIAYLLQQESLIPEETYIVGDRSHDMIGAKANNVTPIGALWGYGSREELMAAGANVLAESPIDLIRIFQRFP